MWIGLWSTDTRFAETKALEASQRGTPVCAFVVIFCGIHGQDPRVAPGSVLTATLSCIPEHRSPIGQHNQ